MGTSLQPCNRFKEIKPISSKFGKKFKMGVNQSKILFKIKYKNLTHTIKYL